MARRYFGLGGIFPRGRTKMCGGRFMAEIVDQALFPAEAIAVGPEGDCRRAIFGDRASYLRGIGFRLHEASSKTIVRVAKDARRVPEALTASRIANDAAAMGWSDSRAGRAEASVLE